jgi:hypothetical protein
MLAVAIGDSGDRGESISHPLVMGLTTATDDLPTNAWLQSDSHGIPKIRTRETASNRAADEGVVGITRPPRL